jgi:hypothetical protein
MNFTNKITTKSKILISIIVVIIIFLVIFFAKTIHNNKTTTVLFYNIPETIQQELQTQITDIKPENIQFTVYSTKKELTLKEAKKYDLLFTWKTALTDSFATKAIPLQIKYTIPTSIKKASLINNQLTTVPLLIDNYEIAYYRTYRNKAKLRIPTTIKEFENFLQAEKKITTYPLICTGSNDKTLLAFISALTESYCGASGYQTLIKNCAQLQDFEKILDEPLLDSDSNNELINTITLRLILDKIKSWQQKELIMPQWYKLQEADINLYMQKHLLGAIFMPLSEHRTKDFILIKYYDAARFPINQNIKNHALIAPVLEGILFNNTAGEQDILKSLLTDENQSKLSTKTMLAPVTSRSVPNDNQAADVRFWAASCSAGPVTDLYDAAFTNPADATAFAENIRNYLRK